MNESTENFSSCNVVEPARPYNGVEVTLIAVITVLLSLMTIVGNVLVMVSFKVDRRLQTVNNYFLLSLAVADFIIGLVSMPLFTAYTLYQRWEFGALVCDSWLALDYLCSNASVLNLLMISCDRYFSVRSPLTYRARRTSNLAATMIAGAWILSFLTWPPWIFAWPYIEGVRSVPEDKCYIQFLETNTYLTVGTALAAFYVPVTVMCILYWGIWKETEKRKHYLAELLAENEQAEDRACAANADGSSAAHASGNKTCSHKLKDFLITLCNVDCDPDGPEDESTSPGATTPSSAETPIQSSRTTSVTLRPEQLAQLQTLLGKQEETRQRSGQTPSDEGIYTIMIRLPEPNALHDAEPQPSVTMITDDVQTLPSTTIRPSLSTGALIGNSVIDHNLARYNSTDLLRVTRTTMPETKLIHPRHALKQRALNRKKQKLQEKKHDKKAARTLSAILMAFIVTWTPYNVLVLVKSFVSCDDIIPQVLWDFSYYLCYLNSTINPLCYALANANFRKTYKRILTCTWRKKSKLSIIRGLHSKAS